MTQSDPNSDERSTANHWWSRIEPNELRGVAWATAWFFFILLGYFVLRPVREMMGTIGNTQQLQGLFLVSFLTMLLAVPVYSALVARLQRRWLVRVVYHFFAICLLSFAALIQYGSPGAQIWTARVFFVFASVFALFSTSVFWSVLTDLFNNSQAKRLFGLVASGGTIGAITGSLITSQVADRLSTSALLLVPVVMIEAGLWCAWRLERQSSNVKQEGTEQADRDQASDDPTGGGLLAGFTHVFQSSYLVSICAFLFLVQACGTHLYFEQAEIVKVEIDDQEKRTQLFAYINLWTQILTLLFQTVLSGLIMKRLGVSVALVILPIVYCCGFASLARSPSLDVVLITMIAVGSVNYGITVPAREVLFTVVSREDKYKSKSFIDTAVLRGGDALSSQIFGSLRTLGISLTNLNLLALPITGVWALVAWHLGRRQRKLAQHQSAVAIPGHGQR